MRKIVLIAIVSIVALVIYNKCVTPPPQPATWYDNKIIASYKSDAIDEKIGSMPEKAELYIDASGSMKPYFIADGTSMINTLSEIINLNAEGTDVYFLDNPKPYQGMVRDILLDVRKQPNNSNTLFHEFFSNAACKLDTVNTIIYLVTDGIMSIHDTSRDMSTALVELRGKITNSLKEHSDLAVAIFRYVGGFKGNYWNSKSKDIKLKEQIDRPYYIIALSRKETMRCLQSVPNDKLNNPEGRLFMGLHDFAGHSNVVFLHGDSGVLEDNMKDVQLTLELPSCLKDIDVADVQIANNGKRIDVKVEKAGNNLIATIPTSIPLKHEKDKIRVRLSVPNKIPNIWIDEWNCDDDINGPDSYTTYGLAALITGIFNGLERNNDLLTLDYIYKIQ